MLESVSDSVSVDSSELSERTATRGLESETKRADKVEATNEKIKQNLSHLGKDVTGS